MRHPLFAILRYRMCRSIGVRSGRGGGRGSPPFIKRPAAGLRRRIILIEGMRGDSKVANLYPEKSLSAISEAYVFPHGRQNTLYRDEIALIIAKIWAYAERSGQAPRPDDQRPGWPRGRVKLRVRAVLRPSTPDRHCHHGGHVLSRCRVFLAPLKGTNRRWERPAR
jgi:hypothetical protein